MKLVNRGVVIVKPKPPFLERVNSDPSLAPPVSMEYLQEDCTAILVPDSDSLEEALAYLADLKPMLFEMELEDWNRDRATWPASRTNELFDAWFKLEAHSMVWDSAGAPHRDGGGRRSYGHRRNLARHLQPRLR